MKLLTVSALLCAMMALTTAAGGNPPDKTFGICPMGWTQYGSKCYFYVSKFLTWAEAEFNCQSMNAHLASVQSLEEYHWIQQVIFYSSHEDGLAWIGGSDAQQQGFWFWIDGEKFEYTTWCPGEPSSSRGIQRCLQMNYLEQKCWDNQACDTPLPSVCVHELK